jgi:hypothetical protein
MNCKGVKSGIAHRFGIVTDVRVLVVKLRQVSSYCHDKGLIAAIGLAQFPQGLLFHRRPFVGREILVLKWKDLLPEGFQVEEVFLVMRWMADADRVRFQVGDVVLHPVLPEKRGATSGAEKDQENSAAPHQGAAALENDQQRLLHEIKI